MILEDFLSPVGGSIIESCAQANEQIFGKRIGIHQEIEGLPEIENYKLALIGVMEDRGSDNAGSAQSPDQVRKYLYNLYWGNWDAPVCDLGNIYSGEKLADTMFALREVCFELIKRNIVPIIIGGSQDLTYGNYRAYDRLEQTVNLVSIDSQFDLGKQDDKLTHRSFLSHIILQKPYILYNFSNIGYQSYFVNQEEVDLMERMYFDIHRLGNMRQDISESEPILRDADIVSFDLSALRQSDAPGNTFHSPNGFSGEEACALARYSGISDKLSSFGIYECNALADKEGRTAHLVAQMIWYFLEGFNLRKGDYPFARKEDYQRFTVLINDGEYELVFYKSPLSGRWWIEVPVRESAGLSSDRHKLIPCSYVDYQEAMQNEIPDRWWRAMQKAL
ncbi:formimidoylglutamase [Croceimicrobium sp.]|uniref:formimidoylglutamase n=1 Tax=Croceimicrobium sp. TaxID=2828340 RepID=UPI003BA8F8C4